MKDIKDKPKEITNKDIQEAIAAESAELLREEKEKIIRRAHKRLRQKFGG